MGVSYGQEVWYSGTQNETYSSSHLSIIYHFDGNWGKLVSFYSPKFGSTAEGRNHFSWPLKVSREKAKPEWPSGLQHCACCVWHGQSWVWSPNLHQSLSTTHLKYVDPKGWVAMLTPTESAGVAPEVNLRITQVRKYVRDSTLALKCRADITRSPNGSISGPTKMTYVLQILFKKSFERAAVFFDLGELTMF